jgi:hypothetical protein
MTYKGLCVFSIFALFTLLGTNQGPGLIGCKDVRIFEAFWQTVPVVARFAFWCLSPPSPAFDTPPYMERGKSPCRYDRVCGNGTVFFGLDATGRSEGGQTGPQHPFCWCGVKTADYGKHQLNES